MTYTVKPGDTLSKIATRNGVTLAQLLQANPQIKDPNKIKVGDALNVPDDATVCQPAQLTTHSHFRPRWCLSRTAARLGKAIAEELGALSAKYETGGRGPGTVSTGAGDPGGVSYGSYQMATKMGVPARFVTQPGFPWLQDFQNLVPGTAQFTACLETHSRSANRCFPGSAALRTSRKHITTCWLRRYSATITSM